MSRPTIATALFVVLILVGLAQGGLAWVLLDRDRARVEAREQAAERAEERTERVISRVGDLLDEIRDPEPDTERAELFRRTRRIEQMVEEIRRMMEES